MTDLAITARCWRDLEALAEDEGEHIVQVFAERRGRDPNSGETMRGVGGPLRKLHADRAGGRSIRAVTWYDPGRQVCWLLAAGRHEGFYERVEEQARRRELLPTPEDVANFDADAPVRLVERVVRNAREALLLAHAHPGQEVTLSDTPPRAFFRVEGDSFARRMAATAHARAAATPDLRPTPSRQDWRHRTSSARTRQSLRALWCLSLLMPHGLWRVAGRSISRTERGPRVVGLTLLLGLASPAHLLRRLLPSGADRWHWRASSLSIQHLRGRTSWIIVSAKNAPAPGAVYRRTRSMHSRMCSR